MKPGRTIDIDLSEDFPHLPGAPIVEAVIQWVARAGKAFESEKLQKQLADRLPSYPLCRPQNKLELEAQLAADGSSTQIRRDTWQGFRLTSQDERYIVQFTRDGLVFSRLAPYQDWNAFSTEALRLWNLFVELAQPSEIQRLGVRFINRIADLKMKQVGQYLARRPKALEPLGLPMQGFLYQSKHEVPGHPFQINVIQTVQPAEPPDAERFGLILDIDVFTPRPIRPADEVVQDALPKMRWLKNKAFFALVSPRAIEAFKEQRK